MASRARWLGRMCVCVLVFAGGCARPSDRSSATEEGAVRAAVAALQAALRGRDVDKLWELLDSDSRADAERAAQAVQAAYGKASAEDKAEQE